MDAKMEVPLHLPSIPTVIKHEATLRGILLRRFMCEAKLEGVILNRDSGTATQKKASATHEKKYECVLPSGVKVSVLKADLTELPVQAVVNAANERLGHYGGLARALLEAGGPQIQRESESYIKTHGMLHTGDAIPTGSGNLPCKFIIHAVGPCVTSSNDLRQAQPLLELAIANVLRRVEEFHLHTVAIPAISSGLFNFPLKECAETIVGTVRRFYEQPYGKNFLPKEILLANHDDPSVDAMERACHLILGPSSGMSYSKAAPSKPRSIAPPPSLTVQLGNVRVILKRGFIQEEQTDVVVNTASGDRNLETGQIASALLCKAGPELQKELYSIPPGNRVIVTKSYGLKCKEVYHTFCIEKSRNGAEQVLFESVLQCLQYAVPSHESIAFPAIGTGALKFHQREVAEIMSQALANFAVTCRKKFEVHFVIYPSDHSAFQAFLEKINVLPSQIQFPPGLLDTVDSHSIVAGIPRICMTAPCMEALLEAKTWLHAVLSNTSVVISNNFIQHFGGEEYEQLSQLTGGGILIDEFLSNGHVCLNINGKRSKDVIGAVLQVEAMLCKVLEAFVREEESQLELMADTEEVSPPKKSVEPKSKEFAAVAHPFNSVGLEVIKMDEVVNPILHTMFVLKKEQLKCDATRAMYQRVPAQFCEMISRVGFHPEIAPPEDPGLGHGIYFASSPSRAMKVWRNRGDHFLYFVEAEVVAGRSAPGKPDLVLPPALEKDPRLLYDSVNGGNEVSVLFSGSQALPRYIITCKMNKS